MNLKRLKTILAVVLTVKLIVLGLAVALYLESGVRGCEIGSVMFAHPDAATGVMTYPRLELVRLAIPRRVYGQAHLDFVADALGELARAPEKVQVYRIAEAPEFLRHFTAVFAPA